MLNIYGSNIKQSVYQLEQMLLETDKLIVRMTATRDTLKLINDDLKLINDDLEADRKAEDQYADKKEIEMESLADQKLKHGEPPIHGLKMSEVI